MKSAQLVQRWGVVSLVMCVLLLSPFSLAEKNDLPELYKKWLEEEVLYIITPVEREVFLKLETNTERDLFIQAFWKHRDPTPGTDVNEFKDEHYRRINHANRYYGRREPKPGWMTDRGRMYIILGEPNDIQRFEGSGTVYPTHVWFYQAMSKKGLPPGFNLVFFQQGGVGQFRLYSPLADGPQALLTSYSGDPRDYMEAYQYLQQFELDLARVSLTLIPGEQAYVMGRPSVSSDILINRVEGTPIREIKDRYAQKFLEYKDIVGVEYTANYIDNDTLVKISKDPSGLYFVNYAIEPERLSVGQYENKYYTTLRLNGVVSDQDENIIHQFEKTIQVEFDSEQMREVSQKPFSIRDMFPLISGTFRFSVIVKNEVSREFTSSNCELLIPADDGRLQMTSILLGYRMRENIPSQGRLRPFQARRNQIYFHNNQIFVRGDDLILAFQIHGMETPLLDKSEIRYTFFKDELEFRSFSKAVGEYADLPNFVEKISLEDFMPALYRVEVTLSVEGQDIFSGKEEFAITHMTGIARPWISSKLLLSPQDPVYAHVIGSQLFNSRRYEEARTKFEEAYQKDPNNNAFVLSLARTYYALKAYGKVVPLLSPLVSQAEVPNYDVYFILGLANYFSGDLSRAIQVFNQTISHYGINTYILNALGECHAKLGNKNEALGAWEKSLEINADQAEIRKKVEILKEKK